MSGIVRDRWAQILCALLGCWLMAAPAVLGYGEPMSTVHRVVGPMAAAAGIVALWGHMRALSWWLHPLLGALLVVVSLLVGLIVDVGTVALVNGLVVGPTLMALGVGGGRTTERYGGGWSVLWTGDVLARAGENERG